MELHVVEVEHRCVANHFIVFLEELLVTCVEIVLPNVSGEPSPTIWEFSPRCTIYRTCYAPQVCVVVSHPTATAIHCASSLFTSDCEVSNHIEERLVSVGQVSHLGRPVVHLRIDVDGVLRVPWCIELVVPESLQISRLTTWL